MPTAEPNNSEPTRAMTIVSVRFGHRQKLTIDEEAELEGVSTSQFIRDAAYGRAVVYRAQRLSLEVRVLEAMVRFAEESGSDELASVVEDALDVARRDQP